MSIRNDEIQRLGFISSLIMFLMATLFAVALIIGFWAQTISNILSYIVSFIIAPAFVIMIISIHFSTPVEKKIWSFIGIAFAIIYAVFVVLTYYTQLAIAFNPPNLPTDIISMFDYQVTGSWMFVVDMLGYSFMTLSTLFTAFAFSNKKYEKGLKRIFIVHGVFVVSTLVFPLLPLGATTEESKTFGSIALLVWCMIFIPLAGLVSRFFWRMKSEKV